MNEDYYKHTIENSADQDGIKRANTEALICLKACAHLDLKERREKGEKIDEKNVKKHRNDVFRLALLLGGEGVHQLPESIKVTLQNFADAVKGDLPNQDFFKDVGAGTIDPDVLFKTLIQKFGLSEIKYK